MNADQEEGRRLPPSLFGRMVASSRCCVLVATVRLFLAGLFSGSPGSGSPGSSWR